MYNAPKYLALPLKLENKFCPFQLEDFPLKLDPSTFADAYRVLRFNFSCHYGLGHGCAQAYRNGYCVSLSAFHPNASQLLSFRQLELIVFSLFFLSGTLVPVIWMLLAKICANLIKENSAISGKFFTVP